MHSKAVVIHGLAGDSVQFSGVLQGDADGVDVDAFSSGLLCLRDGPAGVDVGHAISDDDGYVGNIRAVAVGCREHFRPHGLDAVCRVGAAVPVRDFVNGVKEAGFVSVGVEVELKMDVGAVDDDAHTHVTVVNGSVEEEILNEVLQDVVVGLCHTGGGVQNEDQVHFGVVTH